MDILLAGGRDFYDYDVAAKVLNKVLDLNDDIANAVANGTANFIHGNAIGADTTLGNIVEGSLRIECERHNAKWKDLEERPDNPVKIKYNRYGAYNALAGMNRNTIMVIKSDIGVIVWDGVSTGTKDTINKLKKAGKPCYVFDYAGELRGIYA
jgi:hypothetical protein